MPRAVQRIGWAAIPWMAAVVYWIAILASGAFVGALLVIVLVVVAIGAGITSRRQSHYWDDERGGSQ